MNRITIRDHAYHVVITWLWKETRRGHFPEAFGHLWADVGLAPDEYDAIGGTLDAWLRKPDSKAKGKAIASLALEVSRWLGLRGRLSDDLKREALVEMLWLLSESHDGSRPWDARQHYAKVPGYVAGAATLLLSIGLSAELLAREPDLVARGAFAGCQKDGVPAAFTDVADTLAEMTKFGPITDWIVLEEVEHRREPMRQRLIALLASPAASNFLRNVVCHPAAAAWLVDEMKTKAEKDLLRTARLSLRGHGRKRRRT